MWTSVVMINSFITQALEAQLDELATFRRTCTVSLVQEKYKLSHISGIYAFPKPSCAFGWCCGVSGITREVRRTVAISMGQTCGSNDIDVRILGTAQCNVSTPSDTMT